MFAFLHRDILRTHPSNRAPGPDQARVAGHLPRFAVVQDEQIDPRQERVEVLARRLDPKIHRVGDDKARLAHLVEHMRLERRRDVGEKHEFRFPKIFRQLRLEIFEDIERDRFCLPRVQIPRVFARPAKRLARTRCTPVASMLRDLPEFKFRFGKIVTHDSDQLDRCKKTRADRGVGSGTAELIGVFLDRCFDGIERDGTNNENGHELFLISISDF